MRSAILLRMRSTVVLCCLFATVLLGCQRTRFVEQVAPSAPLVVETAPAPAVASPAPAAPAGDALQAAASKPSLLSLFALTAAVISTVATANDQSCKSDACLATTIANTTVQLQAAVTPDERELAR